MKAAAEICESGKSGIRKNDRKWGGIEEKITRTQQENGGNLRVSFVNTSEFRRTKKVANSSVLFSLVYTQSVASLIVATQSIGAACAARFELFRAAVCHMITIL